MHKDFYEKNYKKISEREQEWRELGGTVKAKNIISIAGQVKPENILDVGCGTGSVLAQLSKLGFGKNYYALDIAETAVASLRAREDVPNLHEAKVFDGAQIPYQTKQFDLAILSHVIEHLIDPVPLILEAVRVANYVAIEVPLEDNLYTHAKINMFKSDYREQIGHIQWFSRKKLLKFIAEDCDLKLISSKMVPVPDEIYLFRQQNLPEVLIYSLLGIRKILRLLSEGLYTKLMTDHYIVLVANH